MKEHGIKPGKTKLAKVHRASHSTFGGVGAYIHYCIDCGKNVKNADFEADTKMLLEVYVEEQKKLLKSGRIEELKSETKELK